MRLGNPRSVGRRTIRIGDVRNNRQRLKKKNKNKTILHETVTEYHDHMPLYTTYGTLYKINAATEIYPPSGGV